MLKKIVVTFLVLLFFSGCGSPQPEIPIPAVKPSPTPQALVFPAGFIQSQGQSLVNSTSGELFQFRMVNFSHEPAEADYLDARQLGFNSVRLLLTPEKMANVAGFAWLDQQIAWAKAANLYLVLGLKMDSAFKTGNQEQVLAFWQTLSQKYSSENVIAVYDLLQEPQPPHLDDWQILAEQLAETIRANDPNHLLLVQATRSPERTFIYLDDPNTMLGLLYFKPFEFTAKAQGEYPSAQVFKPEWSDYQLTENTENEKVQPGTSLWTETNSPMFEVVNRETVTGWPGVTCFLESGEVYFSNFEVQEFDENLQFVRSVLTIDLARDNFWGPWTNGPGLQIEKVTGSPWGADQGQSIQFRLEPGSSPVGGTVVDGNYTFDPVLGHYYTIHGWMRGVEVNPGTRCQFNIEFYAYQGYDQAAHWDKPHLNVDLARLAKYGQFHNLPMMVVEFGASRASLASGGGQWVADMLAIFDELGWHSGYRSYRDNTWGIYPGDGSGSATPELVAVFKQPGATLMLGTLPEITPAPEALPEGFVRARGRDLVVGDEILHLRGTNFHNQNYFGQYQTVEHSKRDFAQVRQMGMNVIRFNVAYQFFEKDETPYQYDPQALVWLDQQIAWAKEAGVYLILNLHYVPGQFETGQLLSDPEQQARAAALWKLLAERYRDETSIAGYDLINEPMGISASAYQPFVQKLVDAIREVDPNHMLIVEAINTYTPQFVLIEDNNVMYDFHFYHPIDLTHENVGGGPTTGNYPDESFLEVRWENGLQFIGLTRTEALPAGSSAWALLESPVQAPASRGSGIIVGFPKFTCTSGSGTAYLGDIRLSSFDSAGNALGQPLEIKIDRKLIRYQGSQNNQAQFGMSPDNPENTSDGRSLVLTNAAQPAWIEFPRQAFEAAPGTQYQLSGWLRGAELPAGSDCRLVVEWFQYPAGEPLYRHNRAFLEERLQAGLRFSAENNVPINIGEFGVFASTFPEQRGGLVWTKELLELMIENKINFEHWSYQGAWGFYADDWHYPDAASARQTLVDVFAALHLQPLLGR